MGFQHSQEKKENNNLKDLITFFAYTIDHLQEVKLNKLIYITQLYHFANHKEQLTNARFFSLSYGPHAPIIRSILRMQLENKSIYLKKSRTSQDPVYSNPCMIIKSNKYDDKNLSQDCLNTLREVVEDWGDKSFEQILDYTTRTIPYLSAYYREPIDFTPIQPCHDYKYTLSLPQRIQIHGFVENPQNRTYLYHTSNKISPISINEVAEIYLALCGEPPDKNPSQNFLGFNLKSVINALKKLNDKNKVSMGNHPIDIDKAALLTEFLVYSMSFRNYSSRVALNTGMFFLNKLGYIFNGDILEDHWPDGNSFKKLKEWFNRISMKSVPGI